MTKQLHDVENAFSACMHSSLYYRGKREEKYLLLSKRTNFSPLLGVRAGHAYVVDGDTERSVNTLHVLAMGCGPLFRIVIDGAQDVEKINRTIRCRNIVARIPQGI